LEVLLAGGADPNQRNHEGTPLLAAAADSKDLVEILLAHGANAMVTNRVGNMPLQHAANAGNTNVIELLLKHGADINARGWNGTTPLSYAVQNGQDSTAEFLLQHGADPNIRNDSGNTPLDLAKNRNPRPGLPPPPLRLPGAALPINSSPPPNMAELLREHGALENLPHLDRIDVTRTSSGYTETALKKATNDWSHFTLLELLAMQYQFLAESPSEAGGLNGYTIPAFMSRFSQHFRPRAFPDLAHLKIRRPDPDLKHWQEQTVDLKPLFESGDCSKDLPLKWGDVVELPEADHPLNEIWQGFSATELANLKKCLTHHVQIVIKKQSTTITLAPEIIEEGEQPKILPANVSDERNQMWLPSLPGEFASGFSRPIIIAVTPFWLKPVLMRSKLVLASSDLSRVKVTRNDPKTGKKSEWIVDCRESSPAPDLWLSDGDIIDVPDRE
jgi:hypothetical protein